MTEEKIATFCEDCDLYHEEGLHKAAIVRRNNRVLEGFVDRSQVNRIRAVLGMEPL